METNLEFAFNSAELLAPELKPLEIKKVASGYFALKTGDGSKVFLVSKEINSRWLFETNFGKMKGIFVCSCTPKPISFIRTKSIGFVRTKSKSIAEPIKFTRTKSKSK